MNRKPGRSAAPATRRGAAASVDATILRKALAAQLGAPHVELHANSRFPEMIRISCNCSIGHDHDYTQWVTRIGGPQHRAFGSDPTPESDAD